MEAISTGLNHLPHLQGFFSAWDSQIFVDWVVLAQNVRDPDVIGQMQRGFQNFIESGQVWALIIGLVLGYGFKSLLP